MIFFFPLYDTDYIKSLQLEKIIKNFPDVLREPILRKVQVSTIPHLEDLTEAIYNQLKNDYFPGEVVWVKTDELVEVIVREKAHFNAITLPSGEYRQAYCKYRVERLKNGEDLILDERQLVRDRKSFTKNILRAFIKSSVYRNSGSGKPWIVKEEYAKRYRINQKNSPGLLRHNHTGHHQEQTLRRKGEYQRNVSTHLATNELVPKSAEDQPKEYKFLLRQDQLQEAENIRFEHQKGLQKIRIQQKELQLHQQELLNDKFFKRNLSIASMEESTKLKEFHQLQQSQILQNTQYMYLDPSIKQKSLSYVVPIHNELGMTEMLDLSPSNFTNREKDTNLTSPEILQHALLPEPLIKPGSINAHSSSIQEDLMYSSNNSKVKLRPQLKLCPDISPPHIIGTILETWHFLNTYSEALALNTFTFDYYLDALRFDDEEVECNLINEIHCSLLCGLMGTKKAELSIPLPELPNVSGTNSEEDNEECDENLENSDVHVDSGNESVLDSTKSIPEESRESLSDREDNIQPQNSKVVTLEETNKSGLYSTYKKISWKERLRRRMFKDGGWQLIIIGLLHSLLYVPEWKESITTILDVLAPLDEPLALFTVYQAYMASLSVELRVEIIRMLCELLYPSQLVRGYLDKCMESSVRVRKERLENLRECKTLFEVIRSLEIEKKSFFPHGIADSSCPDSVILDNSAPEMRLDSLSRSCTPNNGVGNKRNKLTPSKNSEKKKPRYDTESELAETNPTFNKIYLLCENAKRKTETLLEANRAGEQELALLDCQRARMIGKDRYHNRYWWFEGNGMKFQSMIEQLEREKSRGLKCKSELLHDVNEPHLFSGFLMGRLWVQGPTEEEVQVYLDLHPPYHFPVISKDKTGQTVIPSSTVSGKARILIDNFGTITPDLTIAERKVLEEGDLCLTSSVEWGYYDEPKEIDALLDWLNPYGQRELKLSRQLIAIKDQIFECMKARKSEMASNKEIQKNRLEDLKEKNSKLLSLNEAQAKDQKFLDYLENQLKVKIKIAEEDNANELESLDPKTGGISVIQNCELGQRRRRSTRLQKQSAVDYTPTKGRTSKNNLDSKEENTITSLTRQVINKEAFHNGKGEVDISDWSTKNTVKYMSEKNLTIEINNLRKQIEERASDLEDMENDMRHQVENFCLLSWHNKSAKLRLGHTLYDSVRIKARPRKNLKNKRK